MQNEFTREKSLNLWSGMSLLAGIMIGSGIFFLGGQILGRIGNSLPLSLLAWFVGGIITLFSGLSYAELGSLFPENGGYYLYLKEAYGKKVAFLSGTMNLVLASSGSIALLAVLFSQVMSNIFTGLVDYINVVAILVIVLLTLINYLGLKVGAITQVVFMVAKLIPIVMIIVMGVLTGDQAIVTTNTLSSLSFFEVVIAFGFAVVGTLWAYGGWENLNSVAGHMKNANKDLPKALVFAIVAVLVIYVLFIFSLYRLVSYQALLDEQYGWFIFDAAIALFGANGGLVIMISVAISVFGALNGGILVFPRIYQKMAEDGLFFKQFATLDKRFKTPLLALAISAFMSVLLIILGFDVNALLTFVVFAGLIFNTLIFVSVFLFRKRKPLEAFPRYQTWGYPYVPALAIFGMVMLLISTLVDSLVPSLIGLGVLLAAYLLITYVIKIEE
ncbi:MAG: amino acid permease [Firmicutes bacterium]|nr:amino acid permease [Bacillota bacterium]